MRRLDRFQLERLTSAAARRVSSLIGSLRPIGTTLESLALKPAQLGLEFTNLCNANCVFCPYQHQERAHSFMSDAVFSKAVDDYVAIGGGNMELTPIVGDPLIHPEFVARVQHLRSRPTIGRIFTITNGILLDKHGVDRVLSSGLNAIFISTAGFDEEMYRRIYRNPSYKRMRQNVLDLVRENNARGKPVEVTICLRGDRPLAELLRDPDFAEILGHGPIIRSNRVYSDAGGRISQSDLPGTIRLRVLKPHPEACAYTYWGPSVLSNGVVVACNCLASMDAEADITIGDITSQSLLDIWRGEKVAKLRKSFTEGGLNQTCARCTMYQSLDTFRSLEGRRIARTSKAAFEAATGANPR
ncbi:MAG: radical SAM protein [Phycisphaerales bacterium]